MKLSCIDQSSQDGDCYILQSASRTILYGSLLRLSSLSRFLPAYFEFQDDKHRKTEGLSPKSLKRQKVESKHEQTARLMSEQVLEYPDDDYAKCDSPAVGDDTDPVFYKTVKGELYADHCATKFDIRHFQVLDVKTIDIVLISTFQELLGAPFLTTHPAFRGKIYMT